MLTFDVSSTVSAAMLESKSFIQTLVLSIAKHLAVSARMLSVNLKFVGDSIEIKLEVTFIGATVSIVHHATSSVKDDGFAPGCLAQIKKCVTILNIDIKIIGFTLNISSVISKEVRCEPKPAPFPENIIGELFIDFDVPIKIELLTDTDFQAIFINSLAKIQEAEYEPKPGPSPENIIG